MSNLKQNGQLRWTPSYLRRQGQMTPGQKRAYREHWDRFGLEYRYGERIKLRDYDRWFLEIGFGMGENLIHQAKRHPNVGILGIEVHKPGIGGALMKIVEDEIENVRVMRGDARLVLSDYLEGELLFERISVLFPDPWPDESNAHRRIIESDFVELVEGRIAERGIFHIATDVDLYRDHVLEVMGNRTGWERILETGDLGKFRGPTRYEAKGLENGHTIHDLFFVRQSQ